MPLPSHNESGDNREAVYKSLQRPIISVRLRQQHGQSMHLNSGTEIVTTALRKDEINEDWWRWLKK